jgi:hypothetical protein
MWPSEEGPLDEERQHPSRKAGRPQWQLKRSTYQGFEHMPLLVSSFSEKLIPVGAQLMTQKSETFYLGLSYHDAE